MNKCHNCFNYPGPCARPTRTYCNAAPYLLSPSLAPFTYTYDTFYLYTTCSFLKKELYGQVFPTTVAHRWLRINIITPLVASRGTADEQFTLEITCHIDE